MKTLITGGAGFIGSNFIHYWSGKYPQDEIINLDVLTYAGNLENLGDLAENGNYKFIKADIAKEEDVSQIIKEERPDLIINFAAETHVDRSILGPDEFIRTNINGTYNLLKAAKENGNIRFHHISTDEVFGTLQRNDPAFNEKSAYDPRSPYSASKAASDHLVRSFFHTFDLPVTISNCSNNYGPYQFPEKVIPLFVTNLIDGLKVPLYGNGGNIRDWIHVDDHNAGIEAILQRGQIGETYCLGGDHEVSNLELTKKLLQLLNKDDSYIEPVTDRLGHDWRYAIDFSKATRDLDWQPTISFDEGLQATVRWYQDHPEWWRPLKEKISK